MRKLLVLGLVGLLAQLVDGSLGMAYGLTSTTLLVLAGLTPAAASASVHLAEIGTNLASGASHWRLGNVDWRVVARIAGPGAIGAFLGATVLSHLSTEAAAPVMAAILTILGGYVLVRFVLGRRPGPRRPLTARLLAPLGLVAGFVDATGGGGWGPVATPSLLADGRLEPRKVIGSVDTSEFAVSVAASLGFLFSLGTAGIQLPVALVLLAGGLIAAPIAAWLVRLLPAHLLGVAIGGLILGTNLRTLFSAAGVDTGLRAAGYVVVVGVTVTALVLAHRRARQAQPIEPTAGDLADSPVPPPARVDA